MRAIEGNDKRESARLKDYLDTLDTTQWEKTRVVLTCRKSECTGPTVCVGGDEPNTNLPAVHVCRDSAVRRALVQGAMTSTVIRSTSC